MTIRKRSKLSKPEIDLSGPGGNAWALMGNAQSMLKQLGRDQTYIKNVINEMTSGDYDNLVEVFDRELGDYVDLIR